MHTSRRLAAVHLPLGSLAAMVTLVGCSSSSASDSAVMGGDLGHGNFVYTCSDPLDPSCAGGTEPATFPTEIALGSTIHVRFVDSAKAQYVVRAPASDFIGAGFLTTKAGYVALLAEMGGDVLDLTHVHVVPPVSYDIVEVTGASKDYLDDPVPGQVTRARTTVAAGDTITLGVRATGVAKQPLAGSLDATWTSSDPAVVSLDVAEGAGVHATVVGGGTATLHAALGDGGANLTLHATGPAADAGSPSDAAPPPDAAPPDAQASDASDGGVR